MTIETYNINNLVFKTSRKFDIIYCDYIYDNLNLGWILNFWPMLKTDGVFIAQTDWHSNHRFRIVMEDVLNAHFVNELVWKNEWGNHPKNRFHQCYDNIIIYSNTPHWKFFPEKIQVPKVTVTKGLNPSGRTTKTATAWIDNIALTTTAKERVKKDDGHLIRWQKPLRLYDRVIAPFFDKTADILDPFMGSGSLGKWCAEQNLNYVGLEYDEEVYKYALMNIGKQN